MDGIFLILTGVKFVAGLALFLASGFAVARLVLGRKADGAAIAAASVVFAILVPPGLLLAGNLLFGIPLNQWWAVAGAYALTLIAAGALILQNEGWTALGL